MVSIKINRSTIRCVSSKIRYFIAKCKTVNNLKDKVNWDTSFGRVGQHHSRSGILNLCTKMTKIFYLFTKLVLILNVKVNSISMAS